MARLVVSFAVLLGLTGCAVRLPETRACDGAVADHPVCNLQNPEDVVALPGTRWLLASQIQRPGDPPGSIVAFTRDGSEAFTVVGPSRPAERLDDPFLAKNEEICPGPLPPDGLGPHGMELVVDGGAPWMLLVVNHGTRESIEVYDVTPGKTAPRLRWVGCIPLPEGYTANDVAAMPDGEMVISASSTRSLSVAFLRFMFGLPVGDVMEWSSADGWRHVAGSAVGMPNGVAVRGHLLFVADWSKSRLVRIDRRTGRRDEIALPHHPDNLSWTADGRLLVAGQLGSPRIALGCMDSAVRTCSQPWSVLSVDPDTLAVGLIADGDGRDFGAASSAVLAGDTLVVGTWAGDRVLRRRK